jgi:light-regulated signal transduction histidine kinase (bacteriophytochrome)
MDSLKSMRREVEGVPAPSAEHAATADYARAVLNILDDFGAEKKLFGEAQRAMLNVLEDFSHEKTRLEDTEKAVLNILEDFSGEAVRLEANQKAILNILDDFESEKNKVETINAELRKEVLDRTAAEAQLLEKGTALARSNAELEQFAYVASHDLQEPLRMVSSYVQLFATKFEGTKDPQTEKYINYVVEGSRRMQALISGLLEYSRVGREESAILVEADLAFKQALANLQSAVLDCGAEITSQGLPSVRIDLPQLVQVFQNLIGNAIKFRAKGRAPRISVCAVQQGKDWLFSVCDNGIGIDVRHADRIFMIFQRLHSRAEYPGTGIGLSICKKVVERYGGRIWLSPNPTHGTTFLFTLPME